jgi:hypothetical protein
MCGSATRFGSDRSGPDMCANTLAIICPQHRKRKHFRQIQIQIQIKTVSRQCMQMPSNQIRYHNDSGQTSRTTVPTNRSSNTWLGSEQTPEARSPSINGSLRIMLLCRRVLRYGIASISAFIPNRHHHQTAAYRLAHNPGVATSSECPSGSRKYRLVPPAGQPTRLSSTTSCRSRCACHVANSPNGIANARCSAPRP